MVMHTIKYGNGTIERSISIRSTFVARARVRSWLGWVWRRIYGSWWFHGIDLDLEVWIDAVISDIMIRASLSMSVFGYSINDLSRMDDRMFCMIDDIARIAIMRREWILSVFAGARSDDIDVRRVALQRLHEAIMKESGHVGIDDISTILDCEKGIADLMRSLTGSRFNAN